MEVEVGASLGADTILFLPSLSTIAEAIFAAIVVLPVPEVPVTSMSLELKILSGKGEDKLSDNFLKK